LDVSDFQSNPNTFQTQVIWTTVAASGRRFCYVKASEGNTGEQKGFQSHTDGLSAAGLLPGAYHFCHPDSGLGDAVAEAKLFRLAAGPQPRGSTLPPMADIEVKPVMSAQAAAQWLLDFNAECCQLFARDDCGFYTSPSWWIQNLQSYGKAPTFVSKPLWQAQYWLPSPRLSPLAIAPPPWQEWAFWQYGGGASLKAGGNAATCPGAPGYSDLSVFRGSYADLLVFIGQSTPPPTLPAPPSAA